MTVSSVSGSTPTQPPQQDSALRTAFQQLTSAISSGDLKGAQSAYATLTQLQQQSGQTNANNPIGQFLTSIGKDLQNGDITTAQSDLTSFQQARAAHHHKHASGSGDGDAAGSGTLTNLTQAASPQTSSAAPSSNNIVDVTA